MMPILSDSSNFDTPFDLISQQEVLLKSDLKFLDDMKASWDSKKIPYMVLEHES
jgi:hypothetical protein